jgi:uncharacterized LabA/DUF88 family protein
MKRYAFVDVQNTEITALKVLKFIVDNERLFDYLKSPKWSCEKVFLYPGIEDVDSERLLAFKRIEEKGGFVREKIFKKYKIDNKIIQTSCPNCDQNIQEVVTMGYEWKCNCDVELAVDAMEHFGPDVEILLFSGDGDFSYLLQKALERGAKIYIVAYAEKERAGYRKSKSRFSTKLRKLISENSERVFLINLMDLKLRIQKVIDS